MIVKCCVPGCGGTDFMPASLQREKVAVHSFERKDGKLKRREIGEVVVCLKCDTAQVVTADDAYLTHKAEQALVANGGVRFRPVGQKDAPERDEPRPVGIMP